MARMANKAVVAALALGLGAMGLSGCTAQYRNHGYVPEESQLNELVVGVDTRDSVDEAIGSPTTSGVLRDGNYYYVKSQIRHFAYQAPKVVDRRVVAVSFDGDNILKNIEVYSLADGRVIPLSRRVTESSVSTQTFLRQLVGNLGRFTAGDFLE